MFYEDPRGEKFIDDPGYVAEYIIAASSELPCPSCLTGLMQVTEDGFELNSILHEDFDGIYDGFQCQSCERRVLIERRAA